MNTRITNMDKALRKVISVSLVVSTHAGDAALDAGVQAEEKMINHSVEMIRTAAAGGDADALYWLAMMHIEGPITGADDDHRVALLKTSANRGHKDAERMYSFMDHAFRGEGC